MQSELKPCPFCGGAPIVRETVEHYQCADAANSFSCRFMVCCDECGIEQSEEYRDDAIAAWNRRPLEAAQSDFVSRIRSSLVSPAEGREPVAWQARITEFAAAILHGDDEHRDWLTEAAERFNAGEPLPAPRGKGTAPLKADWHQLGPIPTDPILEEKLARVKHDDEPLPPSHAGSEHG